MAKVTENIPSFQEPITSVRIKHATISNLSETRNASNETSLKKLQEVNKHKQEMVKYGWLGKVFGAEENSSKAITFTILGIILIIWAVICFLSIHYPTIKDIFIETFKVITPIITLAFGYLFGKK